jgi:hypothetical protein
MNWRDPRLVVTCRLLALRDDGLHLMKAWRGIAILLVLLACPAASRAADAALPPELADFSTARAHDAFELSKPIAVCVARHDTSNPAFHGCIDWHSSVHGTWALVAYGAMTGDRRYEPLIARVLVPARLAAERRHLAADPSFEMPYGRAWFLRLAVDYRRFAKSDLLDDFADDVAASLVDYYNRHAPEPVSIAYQSASWALINLRAYGVARGNRAIVDFVDRVARAHAPQERPCPIEQAEVASGEFMAICTNWAWLMSEVMPAPEFKTWLASYLPATLPIRPITEPTTVHQSALNFSRAWGLWVLYRKTDEARFLSLYLRHFETTYSRPELWRGGYATVAHWVGQFGMLALMISYEDWPPS